MKELIYKITGVGLAIAAMVFVSLLPALGIYLISFKYIPFSWGFWISFISLLVLIIYACVIREEAERSK